VQKRTDSRLTACQDRYTLPDCGDNHMLFIVVVGIVLIAVGFIPRMYGYLPTGRLGGRP
jgi:hypothetical protein